MTKREFYIHYIRPYLKAGDRPYNRQLYVDTLDALERSGEITTKQADTWTPPENRYF